ncbi:MAG: UDP-glucose/GDP-mannose dehydrogenase family protein [Alphaproteobacteria bacterium]|nr:UDP-glucose/GDP-mannose dehydrogenase family protein [Alphaproteobacteria bacterium]
MHIAVIGTGYVGLVTGACFAELGYSVACVDKDETKVEQLRAGISPIYEAGLDEVLNRNRTRGNLRFTADVAEAVAPADVVFIAVGTPASEYDGLPDMSQLNAAIGPVARAAKEGALIVVKSTVPVGTTRGVAAQLASFRPNARLEAASNPEFLRQGNAVEDFLNPDRVVIGVSSNAACELLTRLYAPICNGHGAPLFVTTCESAEMIKYAANSLLATKVAFINEVADICERVGANVRDVAKGVGMDHRIGPQFLQPGPGFGGSCFPKDTLALLGLARTAGVPAPIVQAVIESNQVRRVRMGEKIAAACGGELRGKTLAILGITFKPGTDDLRESISLSLLPDLLGQGAHLRVYDPQGMKEGRRRLSGDIAWAADAYDAAAGADALVILTEWNEFRTLNLSRLRHSMAMPVIVDLRNLYKRRAMQQAGFAYYSIGRAAVTPETGEVKDLNPVAVEEASAA